MLVYWCVKLSIVLVDWCVKLTHKLDGELKLFIIKAMSYNKDAAIIVRIKLHNNK